MVYAGLIGLAQGMEGANLQAVQWCSVGGIAVVVLGWLNKVRLDRHLKVIDALTVKTMDLLYNRAEYKPPHFEPEEMTPEEIVQWRRSMDVVEEEAVKVGPGTAADLHDSQVNKRTGALPPL